jgi:hypothetical protein
MLAGETEKRNFTGGLDAQAISYSCLGANKDETNGFPNYNCPGGLRAQVFFPSCWNGKDLDSPNHRSHMSYPEGKQYNSGNCPSDYPVHMISVFFEVLYDTGRFESEWNGDQHPFVFANGDMTGYGFHGDFVNGWDVDVLQKAADTCLNDSGRVEDCAAITLFTDQECNDCKLPAIINEKVDGMMEQLPGCNELTAGPEIAMASSNCKIQATISGPVPDYVDLTATKQWEYVGCGVDNAVSHALTGKSTTGQNMTVESCVGFCSSNGFNYAGMEYSDECYCDNNLPTEAAPVPGIAGHCTMKCSGNSTQNCGGPAALSIYHKCDGSACKNAGFDLAAAIKRM